MIETDEREYIVMRQPAFDGDPLPFKIVEATPPKASPGRPPKEKVGRGKIVAAFAAEQMAVNFCKVWNGDTNKEV